MKLMYNTTSVASQDLSRAGDIDEACEESCRRKLAPQRVRVSVMAAPLSGSIKAPLQPQGRVQQLPYTQNNA